jgi:hypothetical protein
LIWWTIYTSQSRGSPLQIVTSGVPNAIVVFVTGHVGDGWTRQLLQPVLPCGVGQAHEQVSKQVSIHRLQRDDSEHRVIHSSFAAAGVELELRNHAMGWNPIYPRYLSWSIELPSPNSLRPLLTLHSMLVMPCSYFCVGEMVGEDVDISVWEFGMMGGDDSDLEVRTFYAHISHRQMSVTKQSNQQRSLSTSEGETASISYHRRGCAWR